MATTAKKFPFVVSCDWWSVSCLSDWGQVAPVRQEDDDAGFSRLFRTIIDPTKGRTSVERSVGQHFLDGSLDFEVCPSSERHPMFACAVRIVERQRDVALLFYADKRDISSPRCIAKVCNSLLYTQGWADLFSTCLRVLGWRVLRCNRCDICADFQFFTNGREPAMFIHDYLTAPTNSRPSFIRRGSNKWRAVGDRSVSRNAVHTISWGKRDSPVQVNMYDKTRELFDVHFKPWIVAKWEANGLDQTKRHVWRVELSINPTSLCFVERVHGSDGKQGRAAFDVSLSNVCTQGALVEFFAALLPRYFQFYFLPVGSDNRRVRDLKPVELFSLDFASNVVPRCLGRSVASGRTERIVAKKLRGLMDSLSADDPLVSSLGDVVRRFEDISSMRQLAPQFDDVSLIYSFLLEVKQATSPSAAVSPLSARQRAEFCRRLARILVCSKSDGVAEYRDAADAFGDCLNAMRARIADLYNNLPADFFDP